MLRNFEVTGFIRYGARIEVSGSKAYALKYYWDFMGFSTYLIFIFFTIKVLKLKLKFSLLLKSVISLVKKPLHVQMSSFGSSFSLGHF